MATICWLYTDWVEAGGNIMPVITSLTVTTILPTRWPWVCPDFSRNFSLALRSNEVLLLLLLKVNSNEPAFNLLMMSVVGLSSITYNSSKEQNQCCCPLPTSCPRRRLKNSKSTSLRRRWTTTDTGATSRSKVNSDVRRHGGRTQWSLLRWVLRDRSFGFMAPCLLGPLCMMIQRITAHSDFHFRPLSNTSLFLLFVSTLVNHWLFIRPLLNIITEEIQASVVHRAE